MEGTIIIADDDKSIRTVLGQALTRAGCRVKLTGTISTLWKWVEDGEGDVVIVDVMMPDGDTLDILPVLKRKRSNTPIIVMSAVNTVSTAVRAVECGAFEYLPKPFDLSKLVSTVNMALKSRIAFKSKVEESGSGWAHLKSEIGELRIIGSSEIMQKLYKSVAKIVNSNYNVLINGLSGTGKSLLAEYIHNISSRKDMVFQEVKLGSLKSDEADQVISKINLEISERASNIGTLFLDEISNLTFESQKKVLLLCDRLDSFYEKEDSLLRPLLISSTSINLEEKISERNFKEDLYYRLNGLSLNLPKLSNRASDIGELVNYFLQEAGFSGKTFSLGAVKLLQKQEWRGNIRELRNFVLRIVVLSPNIEISEQFVGEHLELQPDWSIQSLNSEIEDKAFQLSDSIYFHIKKYFQNHGTSLPAPGLYDRLIRELEIPLINITLDATKGNQIKASKLLGLNRNTLRKKIKDLSIKYIKNRDQ